MTFKKDQIVYNRHGEQAKFVAANGDYFIVSLAQEIIFGDGERDIEYGPLVQWHNTDIFAAAPKAKLSDEIVTLQEQVAKLKSEISELQRNKREEEKEIAARKDRIKQHEKLKRLDDYLAGKITHYVIVRFGLPYIAEAAKEYANDYDNSRWENNKKLKLLTFFGNSKGDTEFNLSSYSDGSGSGVLVFPFCSIEEAEEKAKAMLEKRIAELLPSVNENSQLSIEDLIGLCDKHKVSLPQIMRDANTRFKVKCRQDTFNRAKLDFEKAQSELAALTNSQTEQNPV